MKFVFFAFLLILSTGAVSGKKEKIPFGCWKNSHEEDQANAVKKIYRPCSRSFPAARGRNGLIIKENGEIGLTGPNAMDALDTAWGTWVQIGERELKVAFSKTRFTRLKWKKAGKKKLIVEMY